MWGESSAKQNQMWFAGFLSKPNREECSAQASLSESVCVRVCGGEKGSEGGGVHYWDGTTRRATAVVRSHGKLGEALCSQVGGRGSRVCVLWGWGWG